MPFADNLSDETKPLAVLLQAQASLELEIAEPQLHSTSKQLTDLFRVQKF